MASNGQIRIKANGHIAHCEKLLAQLNQQPSYIKAMPMVQDAQRLAGESIGLARELLERTPAEGGDNGNTE